VRGDYKHGAVKDPTAKISHSHEKKVKKIVKEFMDKAVKKKEDRRRQKAAQKAENNGLTPSETKGDTPATPQDTGFVEWTEDMLNAASPAGSSSDLKRKREEEGRLMSPKRTRTGEEVAPTPPPPPPASSAFEETAITPMDDAFAMAFPDVAESRGKGVHLDGYGSPMQMATPDTNGSGVRSVNGGGPSVKDVFLS
jgi:hypothetical protein